jgi:hypothetical protein
MSMTLRRVGAMISTMLIGAALFGCQNGSQDASSGSSAAASDTTGSTSAGTTPPTQAGTATVSWVAPSVDINGMSNVAGYRIYYGTTADSLTHVIDVEDAAAVSYTVAKLSPGMWYFAVTDYDAQKIESALSGVVEVSI